jgi:hypothetical protein
MQDIQQPSQDNPMAKWDGSKENAQAKEVMKNANLSMEQFDK